MLYDRRLFGEEWGGNLSTLNKAMGWSPNRKSNGGAQVHILGLMVARGGSIR